MSEKQFYRLIDGLKKLINIIKGNKRKNRKNENLQKLNERIK